MAPIRCGSRGERPSAFVLATLAALLLGGRATVGRAESATGSQGTEARATSGATLPRIDPTPVDVAGRIVASTRGRAGAVRLEIEGADGKRLPALLPADDVLERLGLSLRPGETVVLRGSMFRGPRPALVVGAVVVDGRPIDVRDGATGRGPTAARAAKQERDSSAATAARSR